MPIGCEVPQVIEGCLANNIEQVRECLDSGQNAILNQDIVVDASDCDGLGVLDVSNADGLGIYGQGYQILRTSGQQQCSLIYGNGVNDFTLQDVTLEEVPGPDVPALNTYKHMIHFIGGSDICMQNVEVAHSWGYAIYTNGVEGYKFKNSILRDSGVLGLYIGHTQGNPTTDVEICNNTFDCNTTNAIAVLGGDGVLIDNNLFNDNHKLGVFLVNPQFGTGYTGGGQVYLAEGNNITFTNNTIQNGACTNCVTAGAFVQPVAGIEVGLPNQGVTVTNSLIEFNTIQNNTAWSMHTNVGSPLDLSTIIRNNTVDGPVSVSGADYTP